MLPLFQLDCGTQSYDWGKIGSSSKVAQFASATNPGFTVNPDQPYAELWMGTHKNVPSRDLATGKTLKDIISENPSFLSSSVSQAFGEGQLPFLFKVLSIGKALSIQAHPDKPLAAVLHKNDPKNYPDDNHKPEMAIAITPFEGFCGFRPLGEILTFLDTVPELVTLIGGPEVSQSFQKAVRGHETPEEGSQQDTANRAALQSLYGALMTAPTELVSTAAQALVSRAEREPASFGGLAGGSELADLILRLNKQFPYDIGLFCGGLLLNYCQLNPGEAMFLRAKDPHAYISGDIIECMAASDNVVRSGFTPKFKDVDNLVAMLTYSYSPVAEQKMAPQPFDRAHGQGKTIVYDPPIAEFAVLQTTLDNTNESVTFKGLKGPSIFISTKGNGKIATTTQGKNIELDFKTGFVFFVAADTEVILTSTDDEFVSYRAFCEV
ncbi:mannose-6-phosphate isomerase [Nadsonia fulvescens var. elongata DSM 6958]|uniref:Mannose-6-phosphate isomerase n=1 Tax=Nadsonia fulvescens var. elongata DSM 6958 TaxID=857566 RepID=A0A1E3PCP7_9ASCO|nr:mannose-6-phosphate isomerase [Nadsonia fulvescens var. elongata DSM 6958]